MQMLLSKIGLPKKPTLNYNDHGGSPMLILALRVGESIYIDDDTIITLTDIWEDEVILNIDTNLDISVDDQKYTD